MKQQNNIMIKETINNYCTNQNLIVRYPNGAAGKFLISTLFLFDSVAHWDQSVQQGSKSNDEWADNVWPLQVDQWSKIEPNHPWATNFFSRRFFRNNQLLIEEYNQLISKTASEYFFQCWDQGLLMVDHFHKRQRPDFQINSRIIDIGLSLESLDTYKKLVKNKLWLWDDKTKTVISTLDHPDYSHDTTSRLHRELFQNNAVISGFSSYDDFFDQWLLQQHFVKPFVNQPATDADIAVDLLDIVVLDRYISTVEKLEKYFGQSINHDVCAGMHDFWRQRSNL
jgi:hypothetical protein